MFSRVDSTNSLNVKHTIVCGLADETPGCFFTFIIWIDNPVHNEDNLKCEVIPVLNSGSVCGHAWWNFRWESLGSRLETIPQVMHYYWGNGVTREIKSITIVVRLSGVIVYRHDANDLLKHRDIFKIRVLEQTNKALDFFSNDVVRSITDFVI